MDKRRREGRQPDCLQATWKQLIQTERRLQRNRKLCRILQPIGIGIFALNLLLVTVNCLLYFEDRLPEGVIDKLPFLPALVEAFPRGSMSGMLLFSFCFTFLIPLAVCGGIAGVFYYLDYKKYRNVGESPLNGSELEQTKAAANKAEAVYQLRKEIPAWSVYPETGILTAIMAMPLLASLARHLHGESPAIMELALICLALLLCLFVLFWVYALLFKLFSLLNTQFYRSPSEWTLYEQYQRLDADWECLDPQEFARREQRAQEWRERKCR